MKKDSTIHRMAPNAAGKAHQEIHCGKEYCKTVNYGVMDDSRCVSQQAEDGNIAVF